MRKGRFLRLTEAGRLEALGGRDPEAGWAHPWDGKWRLVVFDIPEKELALRKRFNRALSRLGCGRLQGSVWISPTVPEGLGRLFKERASDCSHLMILNADSLGRAGDGKIVRAAWDFDEINGLYQVDTDILRDLPVARSASREALLRWGAMENEAWAEAAKHDPFLPQKLLPRGYLGQTVWRLRCKVLRRAARQMSQLIR